MKHLPLRDRSIRAVGLLLLVGLTGACVDANEPGVGITPISADIVFGADPVAENEAEPVNFTPGAGSVAPEQELPPQIFEPPAPKNFPRPPIRTTTPKVELACPTAALDEFPDETAPINVPADRLPKEGIYRWKKVEQVTKDGVTTETLGFEERAIRNVNVLPADPAKPARKRFTYETVQPAPDGLLAVTRYAVDTLATSSEANSPVNDIRLSAGEPERGLALKGITMVDKSGNQQPGGFAPGVGLLLAPLPVRTGESYASVSVDPRTQQTYRYQAQQVERDRVDACGEILDGWRVEGTLSVSGSDAAERTYRIIVAPHFGEVIMMEQYEGTLPDGSTFKNTYTIGQEDPTPFAQQGS